MQSQFCTEIVSVYDGYDSSYDYTIYDMDFIFVDEEEEEEIVDEFYYAEIAPNGMGDNVN